MRRDFVVGAMLAAAVHAALLFGFRPESQAVALPQGERTDAVEVSLVAAAASSESEAAAEPAAPPAPPVIPPPPEPTAAPEPERPPSPPESAPEPPPAPEPHPSPEIRPHPHLIATPAPTRARGHPRSSDLPGAVPAGATATPGAGPSTGAVAAHGGNSTVRYRTNPQPEYPEEAKREHQQGVVLLSVAVSADGRPTNVAVARSSGFPLLDQAAVSGVRRWTFEPARAGGLPIASEAHVPVRFRVGQ